MKYSFPWKITTFVAFSAALLLSFVSFAQEGNPEASKTEPKGMVRSSPSDYPAHVQVGNITIAAEFTEHSIAPVDASYTNDFYVTAEVGVFGPAGSKLEVSTQNFSMKLNGKKQLQPAVEFASVFQYLKDPLYVSPEEAEYKKNKESSGGGGAGGLSTGGNAGQSADISATPPTFHIPIGVERAMQQKVRQAALPEGARTLPVGGLVFFEHHGKVTSAELMYSGPAGKATVRLQ